MVCYYGDNVEEHIVSTSNPPRRCWLPEPGFAFQVLRELEIESITNKIIEVDNNGENIRYQ